MTLGLGRILIIAALVLFIIAALFAFGVGNVSQLTILGLDSSGLACWVAAALVP